MLLFPVLSLAHRSTVVHRQTPRARTQRGRSTAVGTDGIDPKERNIHGDGRSVERRQARAFVEKQLLLFRDREVVL